MNTNILMSYAFAAMAGICFIQGNDHKKGGHRR